MNVKYYALSSFLLIAALAACVEHDFKMSAVECTSDEIISFEQDVNPIVTSTCAISGCHNGDNGADKDWTVFSKFQSNAADVRDRITRPEGTAGHMPLSGDLSAEEIQTIVCWVDQGALDN
jgi:hypothetical protein